MYKVKNLCVYGLAAMSFGLSNQAAMAQCGTASWYHEGARTANGERYQPDGITAAHRSLPFGTRVQVRNQRTGRTVTVRINDRGPFIGGRIIDLSRGAHRALGMDGLAPVCLAVLSRGGGTRVASVEEGEQRYVRHRTRSRAVASLDNDDDGEMDRPVYRHRGHEGRRHARLARHHRVAAVQHARRVVGELEGRYSTRHSSRAEQRELRRERREAADQRVDDEAGL
jgi:rare lipoprotein A